MINYYFQNININHLQNDSNVNPQRNLKLPDSIIDSNYLNEIIKLTSNYKSGIRFEMNYRDLTKF